VFAGHYGASFLAKKADERIPVWVLFVAVQFLDVLWGAFILLGIEKVRIVPGINRTNALDLYSMPYTHSLLGALGWSVGAALAYRLIAGAPRGGVLVGAAVFSHWVFDIVCHRHDLALYDDAHKLGLGLWDYPVLNLGLEAALLFLGIAVWRAAAGTRVRPRWWGFAAAMMVVQTLSWLGPPPVSPQAAAWTALASYTVLAAIAFALERS
jgi:hypothetical protein